MATQLQPRPHRPSSTPRPPLAITDDVVAYYQDAGPDYAAWSQSFQMHFGYCRRGAPWFRREAMLRAMNHEVLRRLQWPTHQQGLMLDLGCGLGATMRDAVTQWPRATLLGITRVPWQVTQATQRNAAHLHAARLAVLHADYMAMPLPDACADGAYALESACYAPGSDKAALIREMARVVRPGGRVVIADGFRKGHTRPMRGPMRALYRKFCESWALNDLADIDRFADALRAHGFVDVCVEDISWRVAPSVLHVPWVSVRFLWQCLRQGEWPQGWRWRNVMGSLLTMLMGACRHRFSYCIVSARRASGAGHR